MFKGNTCSLLYSLNMEIKFEYKNTQMCLRLEQWNGETIEKAAILPTQNQISKNTKTIIFSLNTIIK